MANYTDIFIEQIWNKANIIEGYNPDCWRQDFAGAWIKKDQYGIQSNYGWEINHRKPIKHGGTDDFFNLIPLHWENNRKKSDDFPICKTLVTSQGIRNVYKEKSWKIETL